MSNEPTLDPEDWEATRRVFHEAVDLCLDHLKGIRAEPVWRPTPDDAKARLRAPLPAKGQSLAELVLNFSEDMLPYGTGNLHPRFFGWVHGAGTVAGALGDMLAGFMNSNVAGRDHVAVYVERQVIEWCKEIFGLPAGASGLLTSGTSMGTVIALAAARHAKAPDAQCHGIAAAPRLVGYASREAHGANTKAFELLGLGADALRLVPVDVYCRMLPGRLAEMIAADRAQGFTPAFVIASAGTVNSGAIDDLAAIGAIARAQNLWFHVDGAFGGLARMVPELRHRLAGIERADSIAFDFHKWLQVPYDAGCVLVRDGELHRRVFSTRREYLAPAGAALGGGDPWFCEYGPEMSRGFRALKVWFTLKAYGTERLAEVIARNCRQAAFLGDEIGASKELELVAPVSLNIACFRYVADGVDDRALDTLNADIVAELQSSGIAAPSTTRLDGKTAIRVCLTNHRTQSEDLIVLLRAVETIGRVRSAVLRPRRRA